MKAAHHLKAVNTIFMGLLEVLELFSIIFEKLKLKFSVFSKNSPGEHPKEAAYAV